MKKILLILLVIGFCFPLSSQITITENDFAGVGSYIANGYDTLAYDLIEPGTIGENYWDISFLEVHEYDTLFIVDPASVGLLDSFPAANYVAKMVNPLDTTIAHLFIEKTTDEVRLLGTVMQLNDTTTLLQQNNEYKVLLELPATYDLGNEIIHSYSSITMLPINDTTNIKLVSTYYDTLVVDAWGEIELPNFTEVEVIRDHQKILQLDSLYVVYEFNGQSFIKEDSIFKEVYTWFTNDDAIKFVVAELEYKMTISSDKSVEYDTTMSFVTEAYIQVASVNTVSARELSIFPNPATDFITIANYPIESELLEIYSLAGKKVISHKIIGESSYINVSSLQTGVYFIKIDNRFAYQKIVIE